MQQNFEDIASNFFDWIKLILGKITLLLASSLGKD